MRILGIEFGNWSIKAVEMESRFRQVEIVELHEIKLPPDSRDLTASYRQAITELMAKLPSHPEKIVTSLPPAQTALRFLSVPVKSRKKVEQMYRFELEDTIPFRFDDSMVEHHVTRTKEGSLVFAVLSPTKHVRAHIEWLKSVGVDPDWLTFEGMGLINLYLSQFPGDDEEESPPGSTLLLDLGHSKTNLAIFDEDRLELFRNIPWGGVHISRSLANGLAISVDEAERLKVAELDFGADPTTAQPNKIELAQLAAQSCVPLFADVNHSLVSYQSQYKRAVGRLVLTGGTSDIKGLAGLLERTLGIPVVLFHAFKGLSLRGELAARDEARFAESIGRALVFARKSPLLFNFRKDELGKETSLRELGTMVQNPHVVRLAKFGALLAVLLMVHVFFATILAEREGATAKDELRKVFQETFRSVPQKLRTSLTNDPTSLKKFIEQKNGEFEQRIGMLSKKRASALSTLRAISDTFPAALKVDVNTVEFTDRNFTVEGVLYQGDLNLMVEAMKKQPSMSNVQLSQNGPRFTVRGELIGR